MKCFSIMQDFYCKAANLMGIDGVHTKEYYYAASGLLNNNK